MSTDNYDTKPTIETVLERLADFRSSLEARFDAFEVRLTNVEKRIENIETRLSAIESGISQLNDKFETLAVEIMETKAAQRDLKRRINAL
jgi:chromosome segregation ATPase